MPRFRWDQTLSMLLVLTMIVVSPVLATEPSAPPTQQIALIQPAPVPTFMPSDEMKVSSDSLLAQLSAKAVFVSDEASASILLSKNADEALYPASATKILTALVARETYYLSQVLTVNQEAYTQGNTMGLQVGEKIFVNQLLQGLLISSGNDAAMVLANNHPQGYEGFIEAMNTKAVELGLSSSHFTNPSGLDAPDHQMTARDLAVVSREVFKDETLGVMMRTKQALVTDTSGEIAHQLSHTHDLLISDPTAVDGKTGTTEWAGQVLVTRFIRADRDGINREVLLVILGSQDRYGDTKKIIDWVMENYRWQPFDA